MQSIEPGLPAQQGAHNELKEAVLAFFSEKNLRYEPSLSLESSSFQAVGIRDSDTPNQGWAVRVTATLAPYGAGINFKASAMLNVGKGWENVSLDRVNWLLNGVTIQWTTADDSGAIRDCHPEFLTGVDRAFRKAVKARNDSIEANAAANTLATTLGADADREFSGVGYVGKVYATSPAPLVAIDISLVSAKKALAILAILNEIE